MSNLEATYYIFGLVAGISILTACICLIMLMAERNKNGNRKNNTKTDII